jgi:hypothetical protein
VAEIVDTSAASGGGTAVVDEAKWYNSAGDMLSNRLPELVKGAGFARPGGNKPLSDETEILDRAFQANKAIRASVKKSHTDPQSVVAGINPAFSSQFGAFTAAMGMPGQNPMASMTEEVGKILSEALGKNITLTSPLASSALGSAGFVPYDLVSPSRLIYPVYSPLRNKIPRVPGQGTSRQAKVITGISGSNTFGGSGGGTGQFLDISSAETVPSPTNYGANMPGTTGSQSATQMNVPYKFFALSESLSWLAQFSGQGFEDISALANLILLQEFMLSEEAAMIAGTTTAIAAPTTAVTLALRTAGANETPLPGSSHFWVTVTAANYFGETVMTTQSADLTTVASTQVVDVTLNQNLPAGAMWWNIYVNNQAASAPTQATMYRVASQVGGKRFTIQGPTIPNAVTAQTPNPPVSAGPTGDSKRITGIIPTLTGQDTGAGYPTGVGWQAGYYNPNVGTHLTYNSVYNMLNGLWNGDPRYGTGFGAFKADPTELIGNSTDIMNLSNDVLQVGAATNYRLTVEQGDTAGVRIGAAVSEFQNPVTRSVLRLLVHPWWPQGTVVGMSYSLPFSWSNISNVWEMTMVQDYLSISWPVIDPTFRYSMFMYGALVCNAPQYCGIMQGLQSSDTTPYA